MGCNNDNAKTDSGTILFSPYKISCEKKLSIGTTVQWFDRTGFTLSANAESPLHDTSLYVIGSTIRDESGGLLLNVELIQFIDASGDITWVTGYNECKPESSTYNIKAGMGKWKDVRGELSLKGLMNERADGHMMVGWELTYWFEENYKEKETYDYFKDRYSEYDTGYSFHGPHLTDSEIALSNGYTLVINNQTGALLSENENSPRHNATGCDRGISIYQKDVERAICDVCFLEDTDADGNIAWLFHEWWYKLGPGRYDFIGGTGKWKGIEGKGRTIGLIKWRKDDWWMPTWELKWNVK